MSTKKIFPSISILLLITISGFPASIATEYYDLNQTSQVILSKGVLYVGGNGTGNYSSIQTAIDSATQGDTIFVFDDSSPYYEHVIVDKSLTLVGENKETTIVDGNWTGEVISLTADFIHISGFTIQYGVIGVDVYSNNNTITDNIIMFNDEEGIYLTESEGSTISYNVIGENEDGIELEDSKNSVVFKNNISDNADNGIEIISWEEVDSHNLIKSNKIASNTIGIYLENSSVNEIIRNNFEKNQDSVIFVNCKNSWTHNFWERTRFLPKIIWGKTALGPILLPWINIDWLPSSNRNTWFKSVRAIIETSLGDMTLELYPDIMPITTTNFRDLTDIDFFDGLVFHRTIENFVIQGGGYYPNGTRKESPFGPINLETHPEVLHVDGAISMARTSNPNSATSQFFICDTAQPHLDGNYSAFGKIRQGFDVLRTISAVETTTKYGLTNWPIDDVIIESITVED